MSVETFEIGVENGMVRGTLSLPEQDSTSAAVPVVVLCRGVLTDAEESANLIDELSTALTDAGIAFIRFEHRCAHMILEDFDAHRAEHDLEDAMAVIRWLMRRPEVDKSRMGLIGYSSGAIAATGVLQSLPSIAQLCLMSATSAQRLLTCLNNGHGATGLFKASSIPAAYAASLAGIDSAQEAARHSRPTLLIHGAADQLFSPAASADFINVLEEAGRPFESVLVSRGDHAFADKACREAAIATIVDFFSRMIRAAEPALSSSDAS